MRMSSNGKAERWLAELKERAADGGVGALVRPGGSAEPKPPSDASVARLRRHAEDLLIEFHETAPDDAERPARAREIDAVLASLPADVAAQMASLRRDLEMLDGRDEPLGTPPPNVSDRAARAWFERDFVRLLELLRTAPKVIPEATRALGRGRAWTTLGFPRAAVLFFQHAAAVSNLPELRVQLLDALVRAGRILEAADLAKLLLNDRPVPIVGLAATRALFVAIPLEPPARRKPAYENLLRELDSVLSGLGRDDRVRSSLVAADVTRGMILDHLGQHAEAREAFDRAVSRDPNSVGARLSRSAHLLTHGDGDALEDLEYAVAAETQFVPAYLFLAHRLLERGEYERCASVCSRGLLLPSESVVQAALYEMHGIAIVEMGGDVTEAIALLENAARLAPANARISSNLRTLRDLDAEKRDSKPVAKPKLARGLDVKPDARAIERAFHEHRLDLAA
jgi:tetratricopeptide (TPR) repeat protein